MSRGRFNLSALAVRERSVTLFLILLITVAGILAFLGLGRAEDPPFYRQTDDHHYRVARRDGSGNAGSGGRTAGKTPSGTQVV
jgi:hypothetical protein